MDRVALRRRGAFVPPDRPLQVAGYGCAFAGAIGIGYVIQGWPALAVMGVVAIAMAVVNAYPHKILTIGRDGVSVHGRRQAHLDWERVNLLAVFPPRGGTVTVAVRARPDAAPPVRPWDRIGEWLQRLQPAPQLHRPRRGQPFTLVFPTSCTDRKTKITLMAGAVTFALACTAGCQAATPGAKSGPPPFASARLSLPAPTGPYRIGAVALHLVDRSWPDPYLPDQRPRQLMISLWYPAEPGNGRPAAPYMPAKAAAHFAAQLHVSTPVMTNLRTHAGSEAPALPSRTGWPVVLFSPGEGLDRSSATALVEQIASDGFVVVTIDHTYEAAEVEFPDGHLALREIHGTAVNPAREQAVRVIDERFVLSRLAMLHQGADPDADHHTIPAGLAATLDLTRVAAIGHSLGGATSAELAYEDHQIRSVADLDGALFGPVVGHGLTQPFLIMADQSHDRTNVPSWAAIWPHLRGRHLDLKLRGSGHFNYTDLSLFSGQSGLLRSLPPSTRAQVVGTVDPSRAIAIERAYLGDWLFATLLHRPEPLLERRSTTYPEIEPEP